MIFFGVIFFGLIAITAIIIKKPIWAIAILIMLGTDVFGTFRIGDLPKISLGSFSLLVNDAIFLFFLATMFLKFCVTRSRLVRTSISRPLIAYIFLTVLEAVLSFFSGTSIHFIALHLRPYTYYLIYFLILSSIKSEDELIQFIKLIGIIAIISAGVTYYQNITGELIINRRLYFPQYDLYQGLNAGLLVMNFTFLILLSLIIGHKIKYRFSVLLILILILIGGALLLYLARSTWITTLLAVGIILILNKRYVKKSILVLFSIAFIIVAGLPAIEETYIGSESLTFIVKDRFNEMEDSGVGRKKMMQIRLEYMLEHLSLLGYGFKGENLQSLTRYLDPTIVSNHNLPGDLAARYGIVGFFVFGWLLFTVFRQTIRLLRNLPNSWQKSFVVGVLAFNIQILAYGYSANFYFLLIGIIIIAPSWAMLELIGQLHRQKSINILAGKTS